MWCIFGLFGLSFRLALVYNTIWIRIDNRMYFTVEYCTYFVVCVFIYVFEYFCMFRLSVKQNQILFIFTFAICIYICAQPVSSFLCNFLCCCLAFVCLCQYIYTSDMACTLGRSTITMCAGRTPDDERFDMLSDVDGVRIESVLVRIIMPPPFCKHPL